MRLKRLELQGFKSFLERTIISFDAGITGVVGPNGCGKSNIVDAILWVMGEQSAKHLRGESMSDVIFNGAEGKAPTSMAEVSLILEKQGASLPPHLAPLDKGEEVAITRRLYRDGTAEYLLNKQFVRLKDIHEVFMDTGVGRRAYSIIEQGQIDRMINVKPDDRRMIFEEVAGITKYRAKRKEAERKLAATNLNIERIDDILKELEKQIRSLKIQATKARKYKEIKKELETADLYLLGRKLYKFDQTITQLKAQQTVFTTQRSELEAKNASIEAELTELDIKRIDEEKNIEAQDQRERELSLFVQKMENQLLLFEEQKKHLANSQHALDTEQGEIQSTLQTLNYEKEQLDHERHQLQNSYDLLQQEIETLENQIKELDTEKSRQEEEQKKLEDRLSELSREDIQLTKEKEHGNQRLEEQLEERKEINEKLTAKIVELEEHKTILNEVQVKIQGCNEKSERVEKEVAQLDEDCQKLSLNLSDLENQLFQAREAFHSKRSRLESLRELQENLDGYDPSAKEILTKLADESIEARPLADILQPESDVEEHLEVFLGEAVNTLLVPHPEEAKKVARKIQESEMERVRVIALSELPNPTSWPHAFEEGENTPVPLLSKVSVDAGYEAAANWWLGGVFICSDMDQLFDLRSRYPQFTFVTADALTIAHGSKLLSCGRLPSRSGIFARRREIEELTDECQILEEKVTRVGQEREQLLKDLEEKENYHSELKDKLSSIHVERMGYRKEQERKQFEWERADKEYNSLTEASQKNALDLSDLRSKIEVWDERLHLIEVEKQSVDEVIKKTAEDLVESVQQLNSKNAEAGEKRVQHSTINERMSGMDSRLDKMQSELEYYEQRKASIEEKYTEQATQLEKIAEDEKETHQNKETSIEERNRVSAELADNKKHHMETCERLNALRSEKEETAEARESLLKEAQSVELRLTEERSEFEHLRNLSLERYQREPTPLDENTTLNLEELPLFNKQLEVPWHGMSLDERETLLSEHLDNLRNKVERYGEVNLTAINEFEEVQTRHDFLYEQREDLVNAVEILESAIKRIDETSKQRFEETFHGVNKKFQEVFPILFNGGKAELALTIPGNLLESGVDIMAQPPGKKLQSISLLSGGEKALTAVSLILAIFARKPSPFCLLDEVDAPLDDANVSRFNTVVRHMSAKSQFIVITHNRRTMEVVDSLYGVTMQRAGVSRMTSVRLN